MVKARDVAIEGQTTMIVDRDDVIAAQNSLIDSQRCAIESNERAIDARDEALVAQTRMIDERDEVIRSQAKLLEGSQAELARLNEVLDALFAETEPAETTDPLTPHVADAHEAPPTKKAALRQIAARELRRQQAIARAAAPYLPEGMVQVGIKAKRAVTRTRVWSRVRGRPAPVTPSLVPEAFWTVFDPDFYTATYGAARDIDPARHYLVHGWFRGLDPSPFFSVSWYLSNYPEVADAGQEPLTYYLETGYKQGHNPQPWFDGAWYAAENPDLDLARLSPLEHFILSGIAAGKSVSEAHFRLLAGSRARAVSQPPRETMATVLSEESEEATIPLSALPADSFDLVTIDLWDTLLRRDRAADAAKVATARRMLLRLGPRIQVGVWDLFQRRVSTELAMAAGADDEEYELANVLGQVLIDLAIPAAEARQLADELADCRGRRRDRHHQSGARGRRSRPWTARPAVAAGDRRTLGLLHGSGATGTPLAGARLRPSGPQLVRARWLQASRDVVRDCPGTARTPGREAPPHRRRPDVRRPPRRPVGGHRRCRALRRPARDATAGRAGRDVLRPAT